MDTYVREVHILCRIANLVCISSSVTAPEFSVCT
jgi:hypothetical protein